MEEQLTMDGITGSNKKIEDFGEKIGGAKKDLWAGRGLAINDMLGMNDAERDKFIKKDNIWEKPDYDKMVYEEKIHIRVAYFHKLVRDSIPAKPVIEYTDNTQEKVDIKQQGYVEFVTAFRDAINNVKTEWDARNFYNNFVVKQGFVNVISPWRVEPTDKCYGCLSNKVLKAVRVRNLSSYDIDIRKKQFCFTQEQSDLAMFDIAKYDLKNHTWERDYSDRQMLSVSGWNGKTFYYPQNEFANEENWKNETYYIIYAHHIVGNNYESREQALEVARNMGRKINEQKKEKKGASKGEHKKRFVPPQLANIKRNGIDYRKEADVTGDNYLDDFKFRGGEFGNWLNEADRQTNLNYGYDAFMDLADALEIEPNDISLGGKLAIAFGARGSGSAVAHYEPLSEVINLTKMKGAGSLAHEWGHAFDDMMGKKLGLKGAKTFMTDNLRNEKVPESIKKLMDVIKYREATLEEKQQTYEQENNKKTKNFKRWVDYVFPDGRLTDEQKVQRQALIDEVINDSHIPDLKGIMTGEDKNIEKLSQLKKDFTGRMIPKEERKNLVSVLISLKNAMKTSSNSMQVQTDFYKNSQMFDSNYSKSDKGYWQSNVEMFARAFSCYIDDKINQYGVSDYLSGHSNVHSMPVTNKEGKTEIIKAYPVGEERKVINKAFDDVITQFKELGFLKDRTVEHNVKAELPEVEPSLAHCKVQIPVSENKIEVKYTTNKEDTLKMLEAINKQNPNTVMKEVYVAERNADTGKWDLSQKHNFKQEKEKSVEVHKTKKPAEIKKTNEKKKNVDKGDR